MKKKDERDLLKVHSKYKPKLDNTQTYTNIIIEHLI